MMHFVGDSHVSVFSGLSGLQGRYYPIRKQSVFNPNWWIYHIGPNLANNFAQYGLTVSKEVVKNYFSTGDLLCLVWGDIDCRLWIIAKALLKNPDEEKMKRISKTREYLEAVTKFSCVEETDGAKCCAEAYLKGIDEIGFKDIVIVGPHPPLALESDTNGKNTLFIQIFNDELRKGALVRGMKFVTLFDRLMPVYLNKQYYGDKIHLGINALPLFVEEFKRI